MPDSKPKFNDTAICPSCGSPAVQMSLDSSNHEAVTWCENGHVVTSMINERAKVVHEFCKEEY
jgi:hypothetical protein